MCEGILIKEEVLAVCHGRAVLVVWLVNYEHVPFFAPGAIVLFVCACLADKS